MKDCRRAPPLIIPSFPMSLTPLQKAVSNWTCAYDDSQASSAHHYPPSHHHHAVGELTLRACPLLPDHFPKDEVGSSFCPSLPSLPPSLPDTSLCF